MAGIANSQRLPSAAVRAPAAALWVTLLVCVSLVFSQVAVALHACLGEQAPAASMAMAGDMPADCPMARSSAAPTPDDALADPLCHAHCYAAGVIDHVKPAPFLPVLIVVKLALDQLGAPAEAPRFTASDEEPRASGPPWVRLFARIRQ